jgi:L-asparaginase II
MTPMAKPEVLLSRSRGPYLEAEHSGSALVLDASGQPALAIGDVDRAFFPRSAVKIFQTLPLLETGAASAFQIGPKCLALAASSHDGTPNTVKELRAWAQKIGISETNIICPLVDPLSRKEAKSLRGRGEPPSVFHNNNSGKHLAAVTVAMHMGESIENYCDHQHPVQLRIRHAVTNYCGVNTDGLAFRDACGMTTNPVSLRQLLRGFQKFRTEQLIAFEQICSAIITYPELFGGEGRLVSEVLRVTNGRLIVKGGSEGVIVGLDRDTGAAFGVKVNDGSSHVASLCFLEMVFEILKRRPVRLETLFSKSKRRLVENSPDQQIETRIYGSSKVPARGITPPPATPMSKSKTAFGSLVYFSAAPDRLVRQCVKVIGDEVASVALFLGLEKPSDITVILLKAKRRSFANPDRKEVSINIERARDREGLAHELTHVIAGLSTDIERVLDEGLAVYVQASLAGPHDRSFPTFGRQLSECRNVVTHQDGLSFRKCGADMEDPSRQNAYLLAGIRVLDEINSIGCPEFLRRYFPSAVVSDGIRAERTHD